MTLIEKLNAKIEELNKDYQKFSDGNKTAGSRSRKHLQEIKKLSQELRVDILNSKKAKEGVPSPQEEVSSEPNPEIEQKSEESAPEKPEDAFSNSKDFDEIFTPEDKEDL